MKYSVSAHSNGALSTRFYVHDRDDDTAVVEARGEARRLGYSHVYVEDENGRPVFDGAA